MTNVFRTRNLIQKYNTTVQSTNCSSRECQLCLQKFKVAEKQRVEAVTGKLDGPRSHSKR